MLNEIRENEDLKGFMEAHKNQRKFLDKYASIAPSERELQIQQLIKESDELLSRTIETYRAAHEHEKDEVLNSISGTVKHLNEAAIQMKEAVESRQRQLDAEDAINRLRGIYS